MADDTIVGHDQAVQINTKNDWELKLQAQINAQADLIVSEMAYNHPIGLFSTWAASDAAEASNVSENPFSPRLCFLMAHSIIR